MYMRDPQKSDDARSFVQALIDTLYRGKPRAELDAIAQRFKDRPGYFDPPQPKDCIRKFSRSVELNHFLDAWQHV